MITLSLRRTSARPTLIGLCILILLPAFITPDNLGAAQKSKEKPYALIVGTVWGPDNHPVYGVPVNIRRARDKKPKWQVYSDHHGEFAQRLPAGEAEYILSADLKHVKSPDGKPLHLLHEVTVHLYGEERVDTGLHLTY